jgi:hypothetical protein
LQPIDGELLRERSTRRKADDPPRVQIDRDGQLEPALEGRDVGDVACSAGVGLLRLEALFEDVRRGREPMLRSRGHAGARAFKLGSDATPGYGRYVNPLRGLVGGLHERAHDRYEAFLRRLLSRCGERDEDVDLVATALLSAVEGLVMHRATESESERMLSFLISRLWRAEG